VSYPRHPQADEIQRRLMQMQMVKQIIADLRCGWPAIKRQRRTLGLKLIWATEAERYAIAERRGLNRRLVA
jgi:hypothetical protein